MANAGLERLLDRHRTAISACRACGDRVAGATPVVSLARRPRVMLVGQAPGQVERESQRPFSGRAGRTLFKWLAEAGLDERDARDRIYIAAITRCYPGPAPSGRGDRVPSPAEQANCSGWLDAELDIIRPELIIPVGRLAIDRFLGRLPLDRLIGREHVAEVRGRQARIIPLPHPSGASSWIHGPGHAELLRGALAALRLRLGETLYL
ncbi:MAG: uracil-DNA glycosylase family protein [Gemmatimonadota bacterium]|nr:uracil-DNA glycosylase family protein [Gemmatimonadota bacterium]